MNTESVRSIRDGIRSSLRRAPAQRFCSGNLGSVTRLTAFRSAHKKGEAIDDHALRWSVPYRVGLHNVGDDGLDRLVELGAIDAECSRQGGIAALMPDSVAPEQVASALGVDVDAISVSPATGRDAGSVWVLSPRPIRIGRLSYPSG